VVRPCGQPLHPVADFVLLEERIELLFEGALAIRACAVKALQRTLAAAGGILRCGDEKQPTRRH
jgi:hypothetical protein